MAQTNPSEAPIIECFTIKNYWSPIKCVLLPIVIWMSVVTAK